MTGGASIFRRGLAHASVGRLVLPVGALALVVLMVLPVPGWVLDIFFAFNMALALVVLMIALLAGKPLDFSAFPTVLLFATLMRLALNVASTRIVLLHGHEGVSVAGHFIEAFGKFLIAGDYIVGFIVFAILMLINLVVIAKGAGRVSEVSARFTLDALPGKQMAIDADLNAGLLSADDARKRRAMVAEEADFYGAMDGASKFVKGDAVAGILILVVNIVGGLLLGTLSHGLTLVDAAQNYVLLAIGDGLVAQIPALLLSIAAAVIVTRVSGEADLAGQMGQQFLVPDAWVPVGVLMALVALLPGMPMLALGSIAAGCFWLARRTAKKQGGEAVSEAAATSASIDDSHIDAHEIAETAAISVDLGYGLIALVDDRKGAPLIGRITAVRRQLSAALGFVVPRVRIRDDLALPPHSYRIAVGGVVVGEDSVYPDQALALVTDMVMQPIDGCAVKDPSFGMDALWIDPMLQDAALAAGYTVVDAATVIGTHLNHLLQQQAHAILGQDEVQAVLDALAVSAPALATNLVPKAVSLPVLTRVLQLLLQESIPIRDFRRIAEAITVHGDAIPDPAALAERIRPALGGIITQRVAGLRSSLRVVVFDPALEDLLVRAVRAAGGSDAPFEPPLVERILSSFQTISAAESETGTSFAVVTVPSVRRQVARLLAAQFDDVTVLGFHELPERKPVEVIAAIGGTAEER